MRNISYCNQRHIQEWALELLSKEDLQVLRRFLGVYPQSKLTIKMCIEFEYNEILGVFNNGDTISLIEVDSDGLRETQDNFWELSTMINDIFEEV